MARRKVKLAFITNSVTRRATYQKRKKGLLKKVSELTTLCGINACAIVYNPFDSQPEVWPNPLGVQNMIARFKSLLESEQYKKMLDQETFVRQRISKLNEKFNKKHKETRQREITHLMNQSLADKRLLQSLKLEDKKDLEWIINQKLKEVNKRIEVIKKGSSALQQAAPAPAPAPSPLPPLQPSMPTITNEMLPIGGMQGQGQEQINPLLPRFMLAQEHINPVHQLFMPRQEHINPVPRFFTQGQEEMNPLQEQTNSVPLRFMPVQEQINPVPQLFMPMKEDINPVPGLFMQGQEQMNLEPPLFMPWQEQINSVPPLFMQGQEQINPIPPLFLPRQEQTNPLPPLFMPGQVYSSPRPQLLVEWRNNPIENMGFGNEDMEEEQMMPFNDNQTSMWPNAFYP